MGGHLRHVMFDGCIIGMNNQWVSNAPLSWAHGVLLLPNCQGHILHRHCHRGSGTCPQNGLKLKWHHANSKTTFDMSSYSVQENDGNHTKKNLVKLWTRFNWRLCEYDILWDTIFGSRLVTQLLPCPWALPWTLVESEEESVGLNRNHQNYAHIW